MSITTRLVTLGPPGAALAGVLDALHAAADRTGTETTVGRADRMPELSGLPDGAYTFVELVSATDAGAVGHGRFLEAAGRSLTACGVPWAWQVGGGPWQTGGAA